MSLLMIRLGLPLLTRPSVALARKSPLAQAIRQRRREIYRVDTIWARYSSTIPQPRITPNSPPHTPPPNDQSSDQHRDKNSSESQPEDPKEALFRQKKLIKQQQRELHHSDDNQTQTGVVVKRTLTKRVIDECKHYYHGFKLLFIDLRISSRYVRMILKGETLTRREHQQLVRSVSDLFRLVPFSVFIIVPFMEFLLPVFLKLFPSMLPSTFQTKKDKLAKIESQLKVKLEMAKFLQETLDDMAFKAKGESHSEEAKKFAKFFEEVRASGSGATNADIIKYSKLFEDEITLDSMTRQQLVACCRLLELQPLGTNTFLRYQLRARLKSLKADDEMIAKEGVASLTVSELQAACRARGMRALGVPIERLQEQLEQWLDLSLYDKIPPSLLLLSRALYVPENIPTEEQLKATIKSLPELAGTEVRYNIGKTEGKVDNKTKLEFIKREEEEIKREEEQESVESFKSNYDEAIINKAEELIERATKLGETVILKIIKEKSESNDLTIEFLESIERDLDERKSAESEERERDAQAKR